MTTTLIRDDFAGPGGWEQGLRLLGHAGPVVGVEHDQAACDTARAAGFDRIHGDVRTAGPTDFAGYIASPPCQTFSAAGKGAGRKHLDRLLAAVHAVADGISPTVAVASQDDDELDERSVLVLEPLRVVRDHRPRWVALEQVPAVLPIWQAYVEALSGLGYTARTGLLQAEQYGVPQTRKRAVLVAVRRDVADAHGLTEAPWPTPTHSKFYSRDRARLDDGVLPWVSMAEALGGDVPTLRSNYSQGGPAGSTAAERGRTTRTGDEPAVAITSKAHHWQYVSGQNSFTVGPGARRDAMMAEGRWREMTKPSTRHFDQPAMTIRAVHAGAWGPIEQGEARPVRVTTEEAGVLQSFPADHPWRGTRTKQYEQIGNAIPPLLAVAVLAPLLPLLEDR